MIRLTFPHDITGSIREDSLENSVMADQKLCDPVALLTELNALDADILLADLFDTLVAMGIILILRVTANVVQQAEIDQDLLVLFRKVHS